MTRIFDRLVGLETEYAIRFRPADPTAPRLSRFRVYEAVLAALKRRVLLVRARHFKEGVFLANGGAVWFEAERPAAGGGLIEGATPECRGPREVVTYQRAQDRLLAAAAETDSLPGRVRLIKNDRDARDNVYGARELRGQHWQRPFAVGVADRVGLDRSARGADLDRHRTVPRPYNRYSGCLRIDLRCVAPARSGSAAAGFPVVWHVILRKGVPPASMRRCGSSHPCRFWPGL